jgi:hypothetical protein
MYFTLTPVASQVQHWRGAAISGRAKGEHHMPASRMTTSKSKRLPPGFGSIDPNAPWDSRRFYTALAATGCDITVLKSDDGKLSTTVTDAFFPNNRTRLQAERFADLMTWQGNKDPKRHQQNEYVRNLASIFRFEPRTEADGVDTRYFHFQIN